MIKKYFLLVAAFAWAISPASAASIEDVIAHSVEDYIRPGYADFATATLSLAGSLTTLCGQADQSSLNAVKAEFANTVRSWGEIELVRFGPVAQDNRLERILFWPDRKSTGLKQVQRLIAGQDESATSAASLRKKSVAVQGLGALEFALYGTGAENLLGEVNTHRCRYASAITTALHLTANELVTLWQPGQPLAEEFQHPSASADSYRTPKESLSEVVGVIAHGLETVRDKRFKPILGSQIKLAKPKRALFWRSELFLTATKANFAGLNKLLDTSQIGKLPPETTKAILASAAFEFSNAARTHDRIKVPTLELATDQIARDQIGYLIILSSSLQQIIGEQLATELGFSVGFSANDGD